MVYLSSGATADGIGLGLFILEVVESGFFILEFVEKRYYALIRFRALRTSFNSVSPNLRQFSSRLFYFDGFEGTYCKSRDLSCRGLFITFML